MSTLTPGSPLTRLTVLSGGVGGATFLRGLLHGVRRGELAGVDRDAEVTVIANTADDIWLHGLKICPDLDTVMYTLGDGIDHERGWGRRDETWNSKDELAAYGVEPTWFGLGDRDIATHLVRTQMLDAGYPLSEVTAALCRRWQPDIRLLPMSDDRVETHIAIADPESPSGRRVVHFQEYWVRLHAEVAAEAVLVVGLEESTPGPGVIEAITDADLIVVPPSNPVVSVGTILGVPGVREALRATRAPVVGLSPIIGGTHVRGMAHQLLTSIGVEVSASGVALHYGARSADGVLDGWLVDAADQAEVAAVQAAGIACAAVPLLMTSPEATATMAAAALGPDEPSVITVWAPDGVAEVGPGDDLTELLLRALSDAGVDDRAGAAASPLADGDIVCVTSKVVSKAEGRSTTGDDRAEAIAAETRRVVARRGPLAIVVNRLGLTMAAAGVDASNVEPGRILLLPEDPDASARAIRDALAVRAGVNVGVLITDTAGRAWREGQTDIAIGAAGLLVLEDHAGRIDDYGNELAVTAPAVADELSSAAELAAGKLGRRPFTVIRGRSDLVLPSGEPGTGASALLRPEGADLFGLGAREAVLAAVGGRPEDRAAFGAAVDSEELLEILGALAGAGVDQVEGGVLVTTDDVRVRWAVEVAAYAHGWEVEPTDRGTDSPLLLTPWR